MGHDEGASHPLSQISESPPPDAARQPSPLKKVNLRSHVNHLLPTCEEAASRGEQMGVHQQFVIPGTRLSRRTYRGIVVRNLHWFTRDGRTPPSSVGFVLITIRQSRLPRGSCQSL